jgi:hypothetical protein
MGVSERRLRDVRDDARAHVGTASAPTTPVVYGMMHAVIRRMLLFAVVGASLVLSTGCGHPDRASGRVSSVSNPDGLCITFKHFTQCGAMATGGLPPSLHVGSCVVASWHFGGPRAQGPPEFDYLRPCR